MKTSHWILVLSTIIIWSCNSESDKSLFSKEQIIVSSDIANFWSAYDAINGTQDTVEQMSYLKSMFLNKASDGQNKMIEARQYTVEEYLNSIKTRSKFWNSIRSNTENLESFNNELKNGIDQLAKIYPDLTHSTIYYTLGNHRSPGTGIDSMVLIGTEFALGDTTTVTHELPEHNQNYYKINPTDHLSFLCVHEYVHTQQKPMVHNLLSLSLYEGIAEFVAIKATGHESPWRAFTYGPKNMEKVRQRFEQDMFKPNTVYNWLWNSTENEFGTSDLGYFVGYQIASRYYDASIDKKNAIKRLIELDFNNEPNVEELVNSTQYFSKPLGELYEEYESIRPSVIGVQQFDNKSQDVNPEIHEITIEFSQPLNGHNTGVDFGELGKDAFPKGTLVGRRWGEDNRTWTIPVELESNKHYQIFLTNNFRTDDNIHLKPYLIEFKTK